jgi:putative phosphotransacetylase
MKIQVEVSARHIHLSQQDLEVLFGKDYNLKVLKQLSQPEEFSAEELVDIEINGKKFSKVRIVGPVREKTQIEISKTDAVFLGVNPPINLSGNLENSLPIRLTGPAGFLDKENGLIIAKRHIHCGEDEAKKLKLKNNDIVSVKIEGERGLVFDNVIVRIKDGYALSMHIDTDEGNSANINKVAQGIIVSLR